MNPSFFQFDKHFDTKKLHEDYQHLTSLNWNLHFNTNHFSGEWSSIALRSQTGRIDDINSFPNQSYFNTPILNTCPYFNEVIDWFECEKEAVRILKLTAGSEIKEHTDNDTSYEDGFFRLHIPIFTNDKVLFYIDNQQVTMKEGECWYGNFQKPHKVHNQGENDRIHLVIDCVRNKWSDNIFTKSGFDIHYSKPKYDLNTAKMIINELSKNQTETNIALIKKLQNEYNL